MDEEGDVDECMEEEWDDDNYWKGPKVRDHCHWTGVFRGSELERIVRIIRYSNS